MHKGLTMGKYDGFTHTTYADVRWEDYGYNIYRGILHTYLIGCVWRYNRDYRWRLDCNMISDFHVEKDLESAKRNMWEAFREKYLLDKP